MVFILLIIDVIFENSETDMRDMRSILNKKFTKQNDEKLSLKWQ